MTMQIIPWTRLMMYVDGLTEPLVVAALANRIDAWDGDRPAVIHGVMLAAPGEEPDWDTPRVPVNWSGFRAAVEAVQANRPQLRSTLPTSKKQRWPLG